VERDPKEERNRKKLGLYLRYSSAGTQLFITVGMGVLAGYWLDKKTDLSPTFILVGTFLGFGAGFYSLYMSLFGRRR
jgi:F0F1-type ATP synthase assembly protein I